MINSNFVILGALILFFGALGYLKDTLKGKTKPNKVSWLIWTIAPMIAFFAEVQQGVGIQSLMTFAIGFVPFLILIASFVNKNAEWKITKFDLLCGALSLTGILLWYMTKVGNIAILFSILADGIAYLPTMVKSYSYPETESANVYICGIINAGIALLTITHWNFQTYAFPIYIFLADAITVLLVQFKLGKKLSSILKHPD
jgi:multisubunit Na+/H+ antiporter MnhG subunit